MQRTVTTLRGVLSGMYPDSTREVRVAVRPYAQETMTADRQGCTVLGNLTQRLADMQKAQGVLTHGVHAWEGGADETDTPGTRQACWDAKISRSLVVQKCVCVQTGCMHAWCKAGQTRSGRCVWVWQQ